MARSRRVRRAIAAAKVARASLPGLATNWRFWAGLPASVSAVLFMGDPRVPGDKLLAAVDRPVFPKGVCVGCGCTDADGCRIGFGLTCWWADKARTRCSCCPKPRPRRAKR